MHGVTHLDVIRSFNDHKWLQVEITKHASKLDRERTSGIND
jgi:hypothetical protein